MSNCIVFYVTFACILVLISTQMSACDSVFQIIANMCKVLSSFVVTMSYDKHLGLYLNVNSVQTIGT